MTVKGRLWRRQEQGLELPAHLITDLLNGADEEVRAAVARGYQPWLEQSNRPVLEPAQDPVEVLSLVRFLVV